MRDESLLATPLALWRGVGGEATCQLVNLSTRQLFNPCPKV